MPKLCLTLIDRLSEDINEINDILVVNMTNISTNKFACVQQNLAYQNYFNELKKRWNKKINKFINEQGNCDSIINDLEGIYKLINSYNYNKKNVTEIDIKKLIYSYFLNILRTPNKLNKFDLQENIIVNLKMLLKILYENCSCQSIDIFKTIIYKYSGKYKQKFINKSDNEIIEMINSDYNNFMNFIYSIGYKTGPHNIFSNFSLENEIVKLIPDEFISLKDFFVKIFKAYYTNLHPIIWAQIFKQMVNNIFVELPYTKKEIFKFISKYVLLNSGPFILKILQMIRPILKPEIVIKYNLTKLSYPLLTNEQVDIILKNILNDYNMYNIIANRSASVAHVCLINRVDNPNDIFIIKIIKPLSIAQSCWEYKTLENVYNEGSCEKNFILNTLESNGEELNVQNEIKNIHEGYKYYNANYRDLFNVNVDADLKTINVIDNIINKKSWFIFAMTLAPGIPLSELIEHNLLEEDTLYRANLHRCLDLLIYKFFYTLINHNYYHGDLHSGNIFYSFREKQLTLIDFGSVGHINLFENNYEMQTLLEIIIMSIFYNYDSILDKFTELVNSKCVESIIDVNTIEYRNLKEELKKYHYNNIKNTIKEEHLYEKNDKAIFDNERIYAENMRSEHNVHAEQKIENFENNMSIYSFYKIKKNEPETIVENKDILPVKIEILGGQNSITFEEIIEIIINFYAKSGVNLAVKFSDIYQLQKAYILLLGVLVKTKYSSYRMNFILSKAIKNWRNLKILANISALNHVINIYVREKNEYNKLVKDMENINEYTQDGGTDYFNKYIKYKTKYFKLKHI